MGVISEPPPCTGATFTIIKAEPTSWSYGYQELRAATLAGRQAPTPELHAGAVQDQVIAAYGVVTRMMTFAYLPLMGLGLGMQAVADINTAPAFATGPNGR